MSRELTSRRSVLLATALTAVAVFIGPATAFADTGFKPGGFGGFADAFDVSWPYALMCLSVSAASIWALRRMARGIQFDNSHRRADD